MVSLQEHGKIPILKRGSVMNKILSLTTLMMLLCFTPAMAREGLYLGGGLVYNDPQSSDIDFLQAGTGFDFKFGYIRPVALKPTDVSRMTTETPGSGVDFGGFSPIAGLCLVRDPRSSILGVGTIG
jgi:hypothetical protein